MPWWAIALLVPCVFSAGVVAGCVLAGSTRALTLIDADKIYQRGLADGLRARSDEVARLEAMARMGDRP